jgi:hypothetical protein
MRWERSAAKASSAGHFIALERGYHGSSSHLIDTPEKAHATDGPHRTAQHSTAQHKASLPTQIPNHCLVPTAQNRTNFCSRCLALSTRTA